MNQTIYEYICYGWIGMAILAFAALQFKNAPYGKFTSKKWGPTIDNRLGWLIMETFVLGVLYYFTFSGSKSLSYVDFTILGLFSIHYIHRSFIYPFLTKTKGKQIPLSIVGLGLYHNLANGFIIGYYLGNYATYDNSWFSSWQFIVGLFIFLAGMTLNITSDYKLIGLRKSSTDGYKIPYGGAFNYISSPNLVGEMTEWIGFAVLSWSLPGFCFAFFTFCNLFPRAVANHKWYKQTFEDYPTNRKAAIPFVF